MNKKVISNLNNCSIVLIGMMGVGKTTIGKMLSEELKFPFYDSDKEIEKSLGKEINDIFNDYGEVFFRRAELSFFKKNINNEQIIISSGGGSFINKEIREKIKKDCISIWLKANKETLIPDKLWIFNQVKRGKVGKIWHCKVYISRENRPMRSLKTEDKKQAISDAEDMNWKAGIGLKWSDDWEAKIDIHHDYTFICSEHSKEECEDDQCWEEYEKQMEDRYVTR